MKTSCRRVITISESIFRPKENADQTISDPIKIASKKKQSKPKIINKKKEKKLKTHRELNSSITNSEHLKLNQANELPHIQINISLALLLCRSVQYKEYQINHGSQLEVEVSIIKLTINQK